MASPRAVPTHRPESRDPRVPQKESHCVLTMLTEGSVSSRAACRCIVAIGALAICMIGAPAWAVFPHPIESADYDASQALFVDDELPLIEVTMDPGDLLGHLTDPWNNVESPGTVTWTSAGVTETLSDVGIRIRGNTARTAIKKPWKLSFNTFVPGRKFRGVEKLNINGMHNDPSIIRHKLISDLMLAMNVPASRATHVRLKINDGQSVDGVYIYVEHIDENFVDAWYGNAGGNLYKCLRKNGEIPDLAYIAPGTAETYRDLGGGEVYQEKLNADPDFTDLAEFIDFLNNTSDAVFEAEIESRFNVDTFLRVMAVDVVTGNWDDIWYGRNNYYLYHDPATDRFEFIPYDMDNTYGVDFFNKDWATRPYDTWGNASVLADRILAVPAYEAQYRRYLLHVVEAGEGPFTLARIEPFIDATHDLLKPYAFAGSFAGNMDWAFDNGKFTLSYTYPGFFRDWSSGWDWGLKPYIEERTDYLLAEVPVPAALPTIHINEALTINQSGLADEMGDRDDWIELYNSGSTTVDVGGMSLTDDPAITDRWSIPAGTTIAPGGFLTIWCDNEPLEGPLHATFKLDGDGESVTLYAPDGQQRVLVDFLQFPLQAPDLAYARVPDGSANAIWTTVPSPGATNVDGGNLPPFITDVDHLPLSPAQGEPTLITTDILDLDGAVATVNLIYDAGAGASILSMRDDGASGDGLAADGEYGATIPGFAAGTVVDYSIEATDDEGAVRVNPPGAPAASHSYVVEFVAPPLFINELMALNTSVIADEFGEFDDWIEIYNSSGLPFDLAGYALSDNPGNPGKFVFPAIPETVLPPGGFLLVWCDDDPTQGPLHTGFRLSANGEQLGLYASALNGNAPIDELSFGPQVENTSFGRDPDGAAMWVVFSEPTPGASNSSSISVDDIQAAPRFFVAAARPNPLRAITGTTLTWQLAARQHTRVVLFDVQGRLQATLVDRVLEAGTHTRQWDGRFSGGRMAPAGTYFMRLDAGGERRVHKLTIVP